MSLGIAGHAMTIKKRHKEKRKQSNAPAALAPAKITQLILWMRGEKVILDRDLARLYGVETKALKQAVRRNIDRFPDDFMLELTEDEIDTLQNSRSQFVTLKQGRNIKYPPMAFTNFTMRSRDILTTDFKEQRSGNQRIF